MPPLRRASTLHRLEAQDARLRLRELGDEVTVFHDGVSRRVMAIVNWQPERLQGKNQPDRQTRADAGDVEVLRADVPVVEKGETTVTLLSPRGEAGTYVVNGILEATPTWWKLAVGR